MRTLFLQLKVNKKNCINVKITLYNPITVTLTHNFWIYYLKNSPLHQGSPSSRITLNFSLQILISISTELSLPLYVSHTYHLGHFSHHLMNLSYFAFYLVAFTTYII